MATVVRHKGPGRRRGFLASPSSGPSSAGMSCVTLEVGPEHSPAAQRQDTVPPPAPTKDAPTCPPAETLTGSRPATTLGRPSCSLASFTWL